MRWVNRGCVAVFLLGVGAFVAAPFTWAQTMSWSPAQLDFGLVPVGTTATGTLTLTNTDPAIPLTVNSIHLDFNDRDAFGVSSGEPLPALVSPGASLAIDFTFTPAEPTSYGTFWIVYSNAENKPMLYYWVMGMGTLVDPCVPFTACGGACVDTSADVLHCGGCGIACPVPAGGEAVCVDGACGIVCAPSLTECDGACVDTSGDVFHCGACGTVCPDPLGGTAVCDSGVCGNDCGALEDCGGACVDLLSDPLNCGTCGFACPDVLGGTPVCLGGACAADCGTLSACGGTCVDLRTDPDHCGSCDLACPAPEHGTATCADGACGVACDPGYVYHEGLGLCVPETPAGDPWTLVNELIAGFEERRAAGTLVGIGPGRSAEPRLETFYQRLLNTRESIARYLEGGLDQHYAACALLGVNYRFCDGTGLLGSLVPPDHVGGVEVVWLRAAILALAESLGCDGVP